MQLPLSAKRKREDAQPGDIKPEPDGVKALPDQLLLLVLQLVDARDLGRLACTCRRLAALACDDGLWQLQLSKDLELPIEKLSKPAWQSWRERWVCCVLPPRWPEQRALLSNPKPVVFGSALSYLRALVKPSAT
eukprot:TRINITY_DN5044_c0_g4_i1.p1 TRINITY_DN5044_c0_g4~~TRINITY_DN5044_c0_g4_i1.p1  ORF type:complete len:134 (+),score=22.37 TRINITY_DN5044_c0_g4_i1:98-499(+)